MLVRYWVFVNWSSRKRVFYHKKQRNIFRNELIRKIIENMDDIKKIKYKDII
jgi:hypothetical protein